MPITTVDTHRAQGSIDFTGLCLSASLDFCIKLWNLKVIQEANYLHKNQFLSFKDQKKREESLLNLERKHKFYITDIQWSPVHPAVFVSLSSDGTVSNLFESIK
jgi:dynein intermediate chain, cytosolic